MGSQKQEWCFPNGKLNPNGKFNVALSTFPVLKVLLTITQTGRQKLPKRAETSWSGSGADCMYVELSYQNFLKCYKYIVKYKVKTHLLQSQPQAFSTQKIANFLAHAHENG